MPTLTAWCYQTPLGARAGEVRLRRLQAAGALEVHCAVAVTWVRGAHRPRTAHVRHWGRLPEDDPEPLGSLARTIRAVAVADAPRSAAQEAAERLRGSGISRDFLVEVGRHVAPGHSALLVLSGRADMEAVLPLVRLGLAAGGVELVIVELAADVAELRALLRGAPDDPSAVHPKRGRSLPEPPP